MFVCENPALWKNFFVHPAEKIINFLFFPNSHERSSNSYNKLFLTPKFVSCNQALHHSYSSIVIEAIEIGSDSDRTPPRNKVDSGWQHNIIISFVDFNRPLIFFVPLKTSFVYGQSQAKCMVLWQFIRFC